MIEPAETKPLTKSAQSCFHCGETAAADTFVSHQGKAFCCTGCKTVYSILQENDLCQYYSIEQMPGITPKPASKEEYAFLDDSQTALRLIDFSNESITKIRFYCPQIHCSSCLWLLENLHRIEEGIVQARVDFLKKEVAVTFSTDKISLRQVVERLASIGYAPVLNLQNLQEETPSETDKSLYYQLGLAGFVFGNIMLLSFPEYLGLDLVADAALARFIGGLNIFLSLPLVLYSGRRYLSAAWQGIRQKHLNIDVPISIGILTLFFRSIYEILTHTGAGYLDSLAGLIFFLLIGRWFQQKTYARMAFDKDYKSYFPVACLVRRSDEEKTISLDQIKEGDILLIRHGELIPADGLLLKGKAQIDYSFVSGESALVPKQINAQLFAGGRQKGGLIEVLVNRKVANSYLTSLWNNETFLKNSQNGQVSILAGKASAFFTWGILGIAGLTLLYWLPLDIGTAINAFTAVLIVACPCAVALSIPFTFGNILRIFSRNDVFLKNTGVIEQMARINHIVFDKTGTLTNTSKVGMRYSGKALNNEEMRLIKSLARYSSHPLSRQLSMQLPDFSLYPVSEFKETTGQGISGTINGQYIRLGSHKLMQVNAPAQKGVYIEIDGKIKGVYESKASYRQGLKNVLNNIQQWAKISLLSGDNDSEKQYLQTYFQGKEELHFEQTPQQKLQYIQSLQKQGKIVAMVGDGLNDAGALSQSEVGIVVSENTSNFTPASDIILDARTFQQLPQLFSIARKSIQVVYFTYFIALLYNIVGLSFAVRGVLSPAIAAILMPLSSITVVVLGVMLGNWLAYKNGMLNKNSKIHQS